MKCSCGHESESWEQLKIYKMNILTQDVTICGHCTYVQIATNLLRLKKADEAAYWEVQKRAEILIDREEKEKQK